MKFDKDAFTKAEQEEIRKNHYWMEAYYKQLKGATIDSVSISVDDDNPSMAFLAMEIGLPNGEKCNVEIVSCDNINRPGLIVGLPVKHLKDENIPNIGQ